MPIRFRKTFKLFPGVKVNLSEGTVKQTVGIPGSGLLETSYNTNDHKRYTSSRINRARRKAKTPATMPKTPTNKKTARHGFFPWGCLLVVMVLASGSYLFAYSSPNFVSSIFQ